MNETPTKARENQTPTHEIQQSVHEYQIERAILTRARMHKRIRKFTLGARDFSSRRRVGLRPTPKIPAAREKNLWYPG